jgi:mRNA-degrading endonuclease RelE of RelBE toxin-antitoxin system
MSFDYELSDNLKRKIKKLLKKDKKRAEILYKKIKQIINSNEETIQRYKNLRHDLSDRKRVKINSSFVLTFKYDKNKKFILFLEFEHHDDAY